MAWPKGKPREKKTAPAPTMPAASEGLAQGVIEGWIPTPDMGSIKPSPEAVKSCSACLHEKGHHYGSAKNWCNVRGCQCQEFK